MGHLIGGQHQETLRYYDSITRLTIRSYDNIRRWLSHAVYLRSGNVMDRDSETQVGRSARVTVTVTPREKQAIKAVAAARETNESNLLRTTLVEDVLVEYGRIREVVGIAVEVA